MVDGNLSCRFGKVDLIEKKSTKLTKNKSAFEEKKIIWNKF